jgi:hypothetical protein
VESEAARLQARELRRLAPQAPSRRPDKRERRERVRLTRDRPS